MMTAEDVAEVVVFVLERPRHFRMLETALRPMTEGVVGMTGAADAPVRWGIISTAHINRLLIPGAHASPKVELVGVASREPRPAEAYAREWAIPQAYGSYEELLADPGDRGRLHLAAEHPSRARGRSARSRPASTCSARSR